MRAEGLGGSGSEPGFQTVGGNAVGSGGTNDTSPATSVSVRASDWRSASEPSKRSPSTAPPPGSRPLSVCCQNRQPPHGSGPGLGGANVVGAAPVSAPYAAHHRVERAVAGPAMVASGAQTDGNV